MIDTPTVDDVTPPPTQPKRSGPPPRKADELRYRFLFRARVIGIFEWLCPGCGTLNQSRMRPRSYTLRCRNHEDCKRSYGLGHVLHELPTGKRRIPDDYLIPSGGLAEAMPEGDVGRWWKSGKLMHCVHTEMGTLAVPGESEEAETYDRDAERWRWSKG